jgi:hypothetical protein
LCTNFCVRVLPVSFPLLYKSKADNCRVFQKK